MLSPSQVRTLFKYYPESGEPPGRQAKNTITRQGAAAFYFANQGNTMVLPVLPHMAPLQIVDFHSLANPISPSSCPSKLQ